jgi:hypothetical protein
LSRKKRLWINVIMEKRRSRRESVGGGNRFARAAPLSYFQRTMPLS